MVLWRVALQVPAKNDGFSSKSNRRLTRRKQMIDILTLSKVHDRKQFDCGVPSLNKYLKHTARQHADKGISRTFVAVYESNASEISGFYTLTVGEMDGAILPNNIAKKYPAYDGLPAIKLARLGIAMNHQKKELGEVLLFDTMKRAYGVYTQAGAIALFVDAKNQSIAQFYQKYSFTPIESDPLQLFIPFKTIEKLIPSDE